MTTNSSYTFPQSLQAVQKTVQDHWKNCGLFSIYNSYDPSQSKYLITTPMPYTDSLMSINRGDALVQTDVSANYQHMKSKRTLFPLFTHYGGTRIQVLISILLDTFNAYVSCFFL